VSDLARHSFQKAFGVSPYRQLLLEQEFDCLEMPALGKLTITIDELTQPDPDYYKPQTAL
jgi:hypothetical protein